MCAALPWAGLGQQAPLLSWGCDGLVGTTEDTVKTAGCFYRGVHRCHPQSPFRDSNSGKHSKRTAYGPAKWQVCSGQREKLCVSLKVKEQKACRS